MLPIIYGPGEVAYHVADKLDIESTGAPGEWDVYVDADGAPLLRASKLMFATGTLQYDVGDRRPTGARHDVAVDRVNITVDALAATTGTDGAFTWTGAAASMVIPGLVGTLVRIVNGAGGLATTQLIAQPGQPVRWSLATDEPGDAQLATYVYGMADNSPCIAQTEPSPSPSCHPTLATTAAAAPTPSAAPATCRSHSAMHARSPATARRLPARTSFG